jgi:hypothetical protein
MLPAGIGYMAGYRLVTVLVGSRGRVGLVTPTPNGHLPALFGDGPYRKPEVRRAQKRDFSLLIFCICMPGGARVIRAVQRTPARFGPGGARPPMGVPGALPPGGPPDHRPQVRRIRVAPCTCRAYKLNGDQLRFYIYSPGPRPAPAALCPARFLGCAHYCPLSCPLCPFLPIIAHCCPLLPVIAHYCPLLPIMGHNLVVHLIKRIKQPHGAATTTHHWVGARSRTTWKSPTSESHFLCVSAASTCVVVLCSGYNGLTRQWECPAADGFISGIRTTSTPN